MKTASANLCEGNLKSSLILILLVVFSCLAAKDAVAESPKHFPMMPSFDHGPSKNAPVGPAGNHERTIHLDGTGKMKHEKIDPDSDKLTTIPHWTGEFSYHGITYPYTMVGTDPGKGSATTVVPTVIIPLRFVFADGSVVDTSTELVDGQTPIQGIINSPIFQPYPFSCGGINVGNTQWGDAGQRANFWNYVSTRSRDYHVLLGQPTVLPAQTIIVPSDQGGYFLNTAFGFSAVIPVVEADFLEQQREAIAGRLDLDPRSLPIFVTGSVFNTVGNWHGANRVSSGKDPVAGAQTFILAGYYSQSIFGEYIGDVSSLSHELSEWVSDPFVSNFTPGWNIPSSSSEQCDSLLISYDALEVCDQLDPFIASGGVHSLPSSTFTYHVEDRVFLDFFTRTGRSNAANGLFSFFGFVTAPTYDCTGHLEFTPTFLDFPGATFTVVTGINNRGLATGVYDDAAGMQHGFLVTGSKYTTLDYPGALATDPFKINDSGTIVGSFIDASGSSHGFSYDRGRWTQIDFPGSSDTEVYGVNSAGKIVGSYNGLQSVSHAFVLENRQYQRIDTPFGTQAEAFSINDLGSIAGVGYTDPFTGYFTLTLLEQMQYLFFDTESFFTGPFTPFVRSRNSFSPFQFPGSLLTQIYSINNSNDLAGFFFEPDGATEIGMVTVYGYPYVINGIVFGNDDLNRICGATYDYNTGLFRGFIATLPLRKMIIEG